nr:hypothetical protein 6 [bacterium]
MFGTESDSVVEDIEGERGLIEPPIGDKPEVTTPVKAQTSGNADSPIRSHPNLVRKGKTETNWPL